MGLAGSTLNHGRLPHAYEALLFMLVFIFGRVASCFPLHSIAIAPLPPGLYPQRSSCCEKSHCFFSFPRGAAEAEAVAAAVAG